MAYKPWEVQDALWRESCKWGKRQNKVFLANNVARRTGNSIMETLRDLALAERSGMVHTNEDGSVEIR